MTQHEPLLRIRGVFVGYTASRYLFELDVDQALSLVIKLPCEVIVISWQHSLPCKPVSYLIGAKLDDCGGQSVSFFNMDA